MKLISSAAFAASQALANKGLRVSRSHLNEVLAALLGYKTLAALQAEESDPTLDYHFDDAERLVLSIPDGATRAQALGLPGAVAAACAEAVKAKSVVPVHFGVSAFYDEYARELLEQSIMEGESTAMAMADSNASFSEDPYLQDEGSTSGDLWTSPTEWSIEASGTLSGEYDPEGDRMYNGHNFDVWGKLLFAKAGRAGLIYQDYEEGASADESWRDDEF
ncbi:hypothetical protein [Pseudoxanthomonas mexicana]|uniref:hypothetical protein n=1 Tax=Pseudoxanthomonas mexicana TaxID=128785 RepID=UPI0028AAEC32|nr:hypothetical protein [Pseudoxanthomonas mexicana]